MYRLVRSLKIELLTIGFVFLVCTIGMAQSEKSKQQNTELKAAIENWCEALESADLSSIVECYEVSDSAKIVMSNGSVFTGINEIETSFELATQEVTFDKVELKDATYNQHGDVAWITGRLFANMTLKADDSKLILEIYSSFVLKRKGDEWKIALDHSTPIKDVPRVRVDE